ncbi:MAG: RNA recognition motif domain-containing protein [Kiritimatiellia bacterium]
MDIYVGNLSYQTGDSELRELFEQYGKVTSSRVITDRFSGQSKGFGFVEMPDTSEANAAIQALNEQEFMGRNLRVNESQPKPRREGGGGFGGGGNFGGGRDRDRGHGGGRDRSDDRRW